MLQVLNPRLVQLVSNCVIPDTTTTEQLTLTRRLARSLWSISWCPLPPTRISATRSSATQLQVSVGLVEMDLSHDLAQLRHLMTVSTLSLCVSENTSLRTATLETAL